MRRPTVRCFAHFAGITLRTERSSSSRRTPRAGSGGIGTALLAAFEREEPGKLVYLYTDSACTYQFCERRGFERSEERDVTIDLGRRHVPLKCLLYSKTIP